MRFILLQLLFSILFLPLHSLAEDFSIIFVSGLAEIKTDDRDTSGGLPELATLLREMRRTNDHLLFFHGGSGLAPSILSTIDKGAHMISILNMLEPDVMAVAKSEFTFKEDELTLRTFEAGFPFINCNVSDPLTSGGIEGIYPSQLIRVGEYTLGLVAVVDPEVITDYLPGRARIVDTEAAIRAAAEALHEQGADMIFLLADYRLPTAAQLLADHTVDYVIVSDPTITEGHARNLMNYHEYPKYSGKVCRLDLRLSGRKQSFHWESKRSMIALNQYQPDEQVADTIEGYLAKLNRLYSAKIGTTTTPFSTRREDVRTGENGFGNLLADILRDFYDADVALVNGGCIRGDRKYSSGSALTRGDIHRELPFSNQLVDIVVTGRQLREALENGLSRIDDMKGRFPHVSGMTVTYDRSAEPGHRVLSAQVGSAPLQPDRLYHLSTLDFLAAGGDGYEMFKDCPRQMKVGGRKLLWDCVLHYISSRQQIAPAIDGRLRAVMRGKE